MRSQQTKTSITATLKDILSLPNADSTKDISQFVSLLNQLLHYKQVTPPFAEIMTVIKHEKPELFHATRRKLTTTSHLVTLFQIDMNFEVASARLEAFVEEHRAS